MASHHPSRSGALLHAKQSPDVLSSISASRTQVGWCLQIGQVLIACLPVTMCKPLPPRLAGFWPCHSARFLDSVGHSGDFLQKNDSTLCSALLLLPLLILNLSRQCQSGHAERLPIPTCKKNQSWADGIHRDAVLIFSTIPTSVSSPVTKFCNTPPQKPKNQLVSSLAYPPRAQKSAGV